MRKHMPVSVAQTGLLLYFLGLFFYCALVRGPLDASDFILAGLLLATGIIASFSNLIRSLAASGAAMAVYLCVFLYKDVYQASDAFVPDVVLLAGIPIVAFLVGSISGRIQGMEMLDSAEEHTDDRIPDYSTVREFLREMNEEMTRARRHAIPLVLMTLEFPHFDRWTMALEPRQMRQRISLIGGVLRKCTREEDKRYRIGDRTFAIIMPHTDMKGAEVVRERIRAEFSAVRSIHEDHEEHQKIEVKFGMMPYTPDIHDSVEFKQRIENTIEEQP